MSEWVQKLRDNTQAFSWHDRQEVAFELELIASQLREAHEQLVKAREHLQEYGQHTVHCDHDRPEWPRCTCGFSEVLSQIDEQQQEKP